jgi:hypothetical protein
MRRLWWLVTFLRGRFGRTPFHSDIWRALYMLIQRLRTRFRLKFVIGHTLKPGLKVSVDACRCHLLVTGTLILTKLFSVPYDIIYIFPRKPTCGKKFPNSYCNVSRVFSSFAWAFILICSFYIVLKSHFNPWIKLSSCIFHLNFNLLGILLIHSVK